MQLTDQEIDEITERVLAEDAAFNDVTSRAIVPERAELSLRMVARQSAVIVGLPIAVAIVRRMAPEAKINVLIKEGEEVVAGTLLVHLQGDACGLLAAERAALNVVQHLSGIATLTRAYVKQIEGTGAILRDTRKTLPGLRKLEKYASGLGGAQNHRLNLAGGLLIKDNHLAFAGGLTEAVRRAKNAGLNPIEIECENMEQVSEAMVAGADILLLDNMSLKALRTAVSSVSGQAKLEASGNVSLDSIREIAETGVDFISVGKITHSAPAIDVGFDLDS